MKQRPVVWINRLRGLRDLISVLEDPDMANALMCARCGMLQRSWESEGHRLDDETYCCEGCATVAGCTCDDVNPSQQADAWEQGLAVSLDEESLPARRDQASDEASDRHAGRDNDDHAAGRRTRQSSARRPALGIGTATRRAGHRHPTTGLPCRPSRSQTRLRSPRRDTQR